MKPIAIKKPAKIVTQKNVHRAIIFGGLIGITTFITTSLLMPSHQEYVTLGKGEQGKGFGKVFAEPLATHKQRTYVRNGRIYKQEVYDLKTKQIVSSILGSERKEVTYEMINMI